MLTPHKLRAYKALSLSSVRPVTYAPIDAADCGMLADAMEIADSCARADIECNCEPRQHETEGRWWDISTANQHGKAMVDQAVRYLDARGLLIRLTGAPHQVQFREEE